MQGLKAPDPSREGEPQEKGTLTSYIQSFINSEIFLEKP